MVLKFQFYLITARSRDEGKGKAPAESSNVYFEPSGGAGTPCLPDTNPEHSGYMDAYGKGQMDRHDLYPVLLLHPMGTYHQDYTGASAHSHVGAYNPNPMGTYHQDDTAAYDSSLLAAWNQEKIGAVNPIHVGTHHQGQTGTYDTRLVGTYGQGQMDSHCQSKIDSHYPSYMNPPYATNIDDLTRIFQIPKKIKTRGNQSPPKRVNDGSRTARPVRSMNKNPDVQGPKPILDTSRLSVKKPSKNPRIRRKHPKK